MTAFQGVSLPDGVRVKVPWGYLRAATQIERERRSFDPGPTAGVVLESEVDVRLAIGEPSIEDPHFDPAALERLEGPIQRTLPLAVLLAVQRANPVALQPLWQMTQVPGQSGQSLGGFTRAGPYSPEPAAPLTESEIDACQRWTNTVASRYDDSINVAVRRLLSAVREQLDFEDALIDGVIVWENLFGHGGTTEVGFRVTSALAHLLQPDPSARTRYRAELSKVYDLRSRVVHGGEVRVKDRLRERARTAIMVGIQALRTLFDSRPELLTARDRGIRLTLGH